MLVLSRTPGQSIVIADDIVITVLEVKGDTVRLGIAAPRSVGVFRSELLVDIENENTSARGVDAEALAAQLRSKDS